jgi:hypothetical protein
VEPGILHGKQLITLGRGAGIGSHNGPVTVEIQKPDNAGGQQKYGEQGELFLLLHEPVRK